MAPLANTPDQQSVLGYRVMEQLYVGSRTAVYRAVQEATQQLVVLKVLRREHPSFSELVQFRNQYIIAKNLSIPGIIQPLSLEPLGSGYALVMEDWGGLALGKYLQHQSLDLAEVLAIALQIADILHDLGQHRVVHKDIKPANILIHPESKQVKLIDFSIASLLPKETQEIQSPNTLEGTLAYLAPEQTGRMNRGIDYRADFYALGITLYQLLTETLPFTSKDPLELVHCHIAKQPVPVDQVNSAVPTVVAEIVAKLMAKNAEDRYQSALGLKHDLEQCLTQWQATDGIADFELGKRDLSDRFLIPERLYGREAEVQTLLDAFERIANGAAELMLVAGFSGIGKTAVVNEVHKPMVRQHGYFIKGKFDQFNRNIPLSAFLQALRDLIGQLLSESDDRLQRWKNSILAAVGENGQILIEVIPALEQIIGPQPSVPELAGSAAQNRFNRLFQKFIAVFTTAAHPLVLFLDDLQWADLASLQLLKLLMEDAGHLLVLGAYRDNEVSPVHPLILTVEDLKQAAAVNILTLAPLAFEATNHLVAETLHCSTERAQPLTQLIHRKTQGNPFFFTQFLQALHREGYIRFHRDRRYWECDMTQVDALALTDDVVDFMAVQLQKLSAATQKALTLAACIGNQFDLATLAIVSEQSPSETATALWEALQVGLILPKSHAYQFFQAEDATLATTGQPVELTYCFLHDRVQQAAYFLIPEGQKPVTHLKIGQLLLNNHAESQLQENLFNIVNQLNFGKDLVTAVSERAAIAHLNLRASGRAKTATAYSVALDYAQTGLSLLPPNCWQTQRELTLALHEKVAESALLCGDFAPMAEAIQATLKQDIDLLDKIAIYQIEILAKIAQNQMSEAVKVGLNVLELLGIEFPQHPTFEQITAELQHTQTALAETDIDQLLTLEPMQLPEKRAALEILDKISAPAYGSHQALYPLLSFQQVQLSLQYGNTPASIGGYLSYGLLLCALAGEIDAGYAFGQLALALVDRLNAKAFSAKAATLVGGYLSFYRKPVSEALPRLKAGYLDGLEAGDLEFAAYCAFLGSAYAYLAGQELDLVKDSLMLSSQAIRNCHQEHALHKNAVFYQAVLNLQGDGENPTELSGDVYDESLMLARHQQAKDLSTVYYVYFHKLVLCYLLGDYEKAQRNAAIAQQYADSVVGLLVIPLFNFYESLLLCALWSRDPGVSANQSDLEKVTANQTALQQLVIDCPINFQHKYDLVEAEKSRILGHKADVIDLYDCAIAGAKANGYIQEEALANELAAKFYLDWGKDKIGQDYLTNAYYGYAHWGAKAKLKDLEHRYADLLAPVLQQRPMTLSATETVFSTESITTLYSSSPEKIGSSSTSISARLDLKTILKASQTLSGEIQLDKLLATLLNAVLESAGADKGALLMPRKNEWFVEAVATVDQPALVQSIPLTGSTAVPHRLINTVKHSLEPAVIVDATTHPTLATEKYIEQHQPKSLLCTPLLQQGQLIAILYLENQVSAGAFTSDRLELLSSLCTQAAISIRNSFLYQELEQSLQDAQRKSEDLATVVALSNGQQQILASIAQDLPLNQILEETAKHIESQSRHTAYCSFLKLDGQQLRNLAAPSLPAAYNALIDGIHIGPQVGSCGTAAYCKASVTVNDIATDPLWANFQIAREFGLQACASTPILGAEGQVLAILAMYQPKPGEFTLHDRQLMEAATYLARIAIERDQADTALQQLNLQMVQGEKMASLGNLVAGVAHEINNPIGFLNGSNKNAKDYVQDLLEHLALYQQYYPEPVEDIQIDAEAIDLDFLREDLPKLLNSMKGATNRIKSISTSLRTFSRADTEHKVSANLHEGLDSTLLILKYRLKANEQRPEIRVVKNYGEIPEMDCFPGQLNQVFMNVLANAIDVLDEAAQKSSFADLNAHPQIITIESGLTAEKMLEVRIQDNGKGMVEDVKDRVFDHLFTTKTVGKGTGLGLAIARQIVEDKHGGSLDVKSEVGRGTEFSICLPICE